MTTRYAVLSRVFRGLPVLLVCFVFSAWIDAPKDSTMSYVVQGVDIAASLSWFAWIMMTPCAKCHAPIGWNALTRGSFKCPTCGTNADSDIT